MFSHSRPSSISLSTRPREYSKLDKIKSWSLSRIAIFAFAATFLVFFGSHLVSHPTHFFSSPGASGAKPDELNPEFARNPAQGAAAGQKAKSSYFLWAGKAEEAFHDQFLSEGYRPRRGAAKVPGLLIKSARLPPNISISGVLPSTSSEDGMHTTLFRAWEDALLDLESHARLKVEELFSDDAGGVPPIIGIPGTGIDTASEATDVQAYLDCIASEGEWVYDPKGAHLAGGGVTVHKQSPAFATCDKVFYKAHGQQGDTSTDWNVRSSLKWRWVPSENCHLRGQETEGDSRANSEPVAPSSTAPAWLSALQNSSFPSRKQLCYYLRHKNILLVGDAPTQYLLHDLLLDWTSEKAMTCYGDLYCKEHGICGGTLGEEGDQADEWRRDETVYDALPAPPSQSDRPVTTDADDVADTDDEELKQKADRAASEVADQHSSGTILRYRRSDSFFLTPSPSHPRHQAVYLHPDTGIRDINMYALPDTRRSDLVIINKPPMPLPLPEAKEGTARSERGTQYAKTVEKLTQGDWRGEAKALELLKLVVNVTKEVWVEELLQSLKAARAPPSPADNLIVYRGGWRMQPDCAGPQVDPSSGQSASPSPAVFDWQSIWRYPGDGPPPLPASPTLLDLFYGAAPTGASGRAEDMPLVDLRTLLYNLQIVLQNYLVRKAVLPKLGIPFLDLESATSVWRSGFIGGASFSGPSEASSSADAKKAYQPGQQVPLGQTAIAKKTTSGDCLRMCIPTPGLALEHFFVGSLVKLFEQGWGAEGRSAKWTGPNFVPVRQRAKKATPGH